MFILLNFNPKAMSQSCQLRMNLIWHELRRICEQLGNNNTFFENKQVIPNYVK